MILLPLLLQISSLAISVGPPPQGTPTPTPEQRLSDFAGRHSLRSTKGGVVHIDDELVQKIAGKDQNKTSTEMAVEKKGTSQAESLKEMWVQKYKAARQTLKDVEIRIEKNEQEISELWKGFYHEDDPDARDRIFAPRLQQKLKLRSQLKSRLGQAREDFTEVKVAARKAGAKPGWFRIP